jgi:hypothetical protein
LARTWAEALLNDCAHADAIDTTHHTRLTCLVQHTTHADEASGGRNYVTHSVSLLSFLYLFLSAVVDATRAARPMLRACAASRAVRSPLLRRGSSGPQRPLSARAQARLPPVYSLQRRRENTETSECELSDVAERSQGRQTRKKTPQTRAKGCSPFVLIVCGLCRARRAKWGGRRACWCERRARNNANLHICTPKQHAHAPGKGCRLPLYMGSSPPVYSKRFIFQKGM